MSLKQSGWFKFYGKETYLKAIEIFEVKRNIEPMTTFIPASNKASDKFIMDRQKELFNLLDHKEVK